MGGKRQNIQYSLALDPPDRGEPPLGGHQGTEPPVAKPGPESSALENPASVSGLRHRHSSFASVPVSNILSRGSAALRSRI